MNDKMREYLQYFPETGKIIWIKKSACNTVLGSVAGTNCNGYLRVRFKGKIYIYHRVAWFLHFGKEPSTPYIDHINGDPLDNRICNLREASPSENQQNRKCHRAGTPVGIYLCANRYVVRVPKFFGTHRGEARKYIGRFKTLEEANAALDSHREVLHD